MRALDICTCGHDRIIHDGRNCQAYGCSCAQWTPQPQPVTDPVIRKMPKQKPGRSVQDVGTPDWLIKVIEQTWGKIGLDPAASDANHVCPLYYTEKDNGLLQSWMVPAGCIVFINPPYNDIKSWVQAAYASANFYARTVVVLVPASVGANWWAEHVDQKAAVYFIRPRLVFKGHTDPYPKDLALLVYGDPPGYKCVHVTSQTLKIEELNGNPDGSVN